MSDIQYLSLKLDLVRVSWSEVVKAESKHIEAPKAKGRGRIKCRRSCNGTIQAEE